MPETNWRDLPAGPELDALVAERVLGYEVEPYGRVSTTWAGAGLVVEAMEKCAWMLQLTDEWYSYPRWRAEFMSRLPGRNHWRGSGRLKADTAPLAICRAALAALEGP